MGLSYGILCRRNNTRKNALRLSPIFYDVRPLFAPPFRLTVSVSDYKMPALGIVMVCEPVTV